MKKLSITVLGALLLSSCAHYYYVPNVQNVPLFKEKNEYRFSASYGVGDESTSAEVQAAYSPTSNIGLMANYISASGGNSTGENSAKGYYLEGAAGYYKPIRKAAVFEIYGGLGGGSQNHKYCNLFSNQSYGTTNLSSVKVFIQPSFGMTFNAFDVAFSTRLCSVFFTDVINNTNNDYESCVVYDIGVKNRAFIEPAITLRGGSKNVKFQVQGLISTDLSNPTLQIGERYHFSAGMYFTIANRYKTSKTNNNK